MPSTFGPRLWVSMVGIRETDAEDPQETTTSRDFELTLSFAR